jgi:hypothetical protein
MGFDMPCNPNVQWSVTSGAMSDTSERRNAPSMGRAFMTCVVVGVAVSVSQGQAPGGVSSGLAVWYKADQNVVGNPVSAWNTSGGSASTYHLTQSTSAYRPAVIQGNVDYKRYNYNKRIDFAVASSKRLQNTSTSPNLYGTGGSVFLVTDQDPSGGNGTGLTYSSGLSTQRIQIKPSFRIQTSTGSLGYTGDHSAPTEYSNRSASILSVTGLGSSATHRLNSTPYPCTNCGSGVYNPVITTGLHVGRNGGGSEYVDCDMGEIIIYSAALTTAQIQRVESYLAIKYGITRGGNTGTSSTYNYVNSGGTAIWDKTTNSGFNNDIAGIGRDDGSALVQKQSISVNNAESVSIGLVSIDASNAANSNTFSANNSFVMWGNNGGAQNTVFSDPACFANMPVGVQAKVQRTWKVQATNFSQTVTIGFEASALVGYAPIANLRLLVDNDGTNWSNATVVSGAVVDGTRIEFAGVSLSAARPYFTLATSDFTATPLPVELLFFNARPYGSGAVDLEWATASEMGNDHFVVERSQDGMDFQDIGRVQGNGGSMVREDYGLRDPAPILGVGYYRLKQVDVNGAITYSNVVAVTLGSDDRLNVFPNPAHGLVRIVGMPTEVGSPLELFDACGAKVPIFPIGSDMGVLDVSTLPKGVYLLRVDGRTARIVKE